LGTVGKVSKHGSDKRTAPVTAGVGRGQQQRTRGDEALLHGQAEVERRLSVGDSPVGGPDRGHFWTHSRYAVDQDFGIRAVADLMDAHTRHR